ncbi:MBL fold metallo-hydrolase [Candidatus Woesearchaeota archaeon]|nr:MBL fold metallo-hydrolase [Candidatus Woesearchaeota archaeon]
MRIDNIGLYWLGHSGFLIKTDKIIYIDPYQINENSEKADIIFITHSHYDHCSFEDIKKIVKKNTKIILTADSQSKITRLSIPVEIKIVEPNKEFFIDNIKVNTIPAYNIENQGHEKTEGWVGYIIRIKNVIIYHAGDTDFIPEMNNLTGYNQKNVKFITLMPISGRFTMNIDEALEAVKKIKPFLVIPMHYGNIVGTKEDAEEFTSLCKENNIDAKILDKGIIN